MKVSEYIANRCKELNPHVFLMVGGGNMYLTDSLGKCGVRCVFMHHEQALAMAAEGYARITGKPSVCVVTTGPGGTNAITGVFGAWVDSIPVIFISGQVRTNLMRKGQIRQIGDQEINIVDLVRPITKLSMTVTDPADIEYAFDLAILEATSGRQGPVWLDIPLDIQRAEFVGTTKKATTRSTPDDMDVYPIARSLTASYLKPVIIAGSGIRSAGAIDTFWELMRKLDVPTIPSFNSRDLGQFEYPAFGMNGHTKCNEIINEADFLLILGCRMNIRQIGWDLGKLARKATKVMVDIDKEELDKATFIPNHKIHADVGVFLKKLSRLIWESYTNGWAPGVKWECGPNSYEYVTMDNFTHALDAVTEPGDAIVCANGMAPTVVLQRAQVKKDMRLLINSGCGAMGWGLPVAIGADCATDGRVICIEGDGSIQLNIQELETIAFNKQNIKIFIVNNNGYGSIRATQDAYFEGCHIGTDPAHGLGLPKMSRIAKAYNIPYFSVKNDQDLHSIIDIFAVEGPTICELFIDPGFKLEKGEI